MKNNRTASFIAQYNEVIPGDIIIFSCPKITSTAQKGIMAAQSLIRKTHGHYDSTHAAICTGKTQDGSPIVAHVNGHQVMGYRQEPLADVIAEDGNDRALHVYRPNNRIIANRIAEVASNEEENKKIKWAISAAISAFTKTSSLNPNRKIKKEKYFSSNSFCSKFVIQSIKIATHSTEKSAYYPDLRSSSSPKTLESYLYNDSNYNLLICPGRNNPYDHMKKVISDQIERISKKNNTQSKKKYNALASQYHQITSDLDNHSRLNPLDKTFNLLNKIMPYLELRTNSADFRTATSARIVIKEARRMGIFMNIVHNAALKKPAPSSTSTAIEPFAASTIATTSVSKNGFFGVHKNTYSKTNNIYLKSRRQFFSF